MSQINFYNVDCGKFMKSKPDKFYDLAIVDPPFGINAGNYSNKPFKVKQKNGTYLKTSKPKYSKKNWDLKPADSIYGKELFRISKEQIIKGANYFNWLGFETFKTPKRTEFNQFITDRPTNWIIWDKMNGASDQMDCELLWTSIPIKSYIYQYLWAGMLQGSKVNGKIQEGNKRKNEKRIHPTQTPIQLYRKLLVEYALKGYKILDTHGGSMTNAIACDLEGFDLDICEIDKEYFDKGVEAFKIHKAQLKLF